MPAKAHYTVSVQQTAMATPAQASVFLETYTWLTKNVDFL
jgi:hypothetical protein